MNYQTEFTLKQFQSKNNNKQIDKTKIVTRMKSSNKILLNEFKSKLRKILNTHPSQSIRFPEFMELLTSNNVRSYSKNQITKLSKFFDNPLKICRIQVPLSYLQLECVQDNGRNRYFIIKVVSQPVHAGLYENKDKKHTVYKCLQAFTGLLKRLYGSQKNWFKVLGGLTVAITIDITTFRKSLNKILSNTNHSDCTQQLLQLFLKQSKSNCIQWKGFMKIVTNAILINSSNLCQQKQLQERISIKRQSVDFKPRHERRASLPITQIKSQIPPPNPRLSPKRRLTLKTVFTQREQQYQFPRYFCISAKPCILYQKQQKYKIRSTMAPSMNTTNTKKFYHRKAKTEINFFIKDATEIVSSENPKTEYIQILTQPNQKQIQIVQPTNTQNKMLQQEITQQKRDQPDNIKQSE